MLEKHKDLSLYNKNQFSQAKGLKIGIVKSRWNKTITNNLFEGAYNTLIDCGINKKDIIKYEVPGSFELIFGAMSIYKQNVDAIICLGSVIKGDTKHFDFICNAVANGIKDLNIKLEIPVIFGVLTDNNLQQAIDRSGGKNGNKGVEAAVTALEMAILNKR
ncbi:MAG: 6,7-dimethyl-8-ribityllumazine synthase [Flavobacteriales bacterium]|nr:6,7-dimethyl-8-ribityllumazine synthase [Flavobacteriales bacterium]|tara:strand:- start:93 stop:575 length:483 start_codon:yes stop_codon:yes gene_type:complete